MCLGRAVTEPEAPPDPGAVLLAQTRPVTGHLAQRAGMMLPPSSGAVFWRGSRAEHGGETEALQHEPTVPRGSASVVNGRWNNTFSRLRACG